jgi:hypothetical protein
MNPDVIQTLIKDYQASFKRNLTRRDLDIPRIRDMAISIVGARRCGKTYRTYQLAADLVSSGMPNEAVCRVQFNDHRLAGLTSSQLSTIDFSYYSLFPDRRRGEAEVWFILDEIQRIEGWEDYVLSLLDTPSHRVLITGSTSKLLRGAIAAGLRGKNFSLELFPFSFKEFARHYGVAADITSSDGQARLRNLTGKYLLQGGFPGLLDLEPLRHVDLLQSYWDTMVVRDIAEGHPHDEINISNLMTLGRLFCERIGCPMTVRKIAELLRERGVKTAPETLHRYLEYFEEAFMIYSVPIFSPSDAVRNRNYRKIYAVDWALADAVAGGGPLSLSRKLENAVFIELQRRGRDVFYYKTKKDHEVDFVSVSRGDRSQATEIFQVCYSIDSPETMDREIRGLPETARFLNAERAYVITMDEDREVQIDGCKVCLVPAWKWFMQ